jgi:hypothetical protein
MNRSIQLRLITLVGSVIFLSFAVVTPTKADAAIAPCAIDLSGLQDPRISDDLRRTLQTDFYLYLLVAQRKPLPIPIRYELEESEGNTTYTLQSQSWPINCGIYVYLSKATYTYRSMNGTRTETSLSLGNWNLFSETIDGTSRYTNQLVSLQVSGAAKLFNIGDRRIVRRIYRDDSHHTESMLEECEVTDSRPASTIAPRLTGNVIATLCKSKTSSSPPYESARPGFTDYSFTWSQGCSFEGREASEFHPSLEGAAVQATCDGRTLVWLAEYGFAIPGKPKIDEREATEFYSNFSGRALVVSDPVTGWKPTVLFPALKLALQIDTIDPAGLRIAPNKRRLLLKLEPIQ